jgi:hypothetical protein
VISCVKGRRPEPLDHGGDPVSHCKCRDQEPAIAAALVSVAPRAAVRGASSAPSGGDRARAEALVDGLSASVVGGLLQRYPELAETLDRWSTDEDFWIRRSALLALLLPLRRGQGDFARFGRYADAMLEERCSVLVPPQIDERTGRFSGAWDPHGHHPPSSDRSLRARPPRSSVFRTGRESALSSGVAGARRCLLRHG